MSELTKLLWNLAKSDVSDCELDEELAGTWELDEADYRGALHRHLRGSL